MLTPADIDLLIDKLHGDGGDDPAVRVADIREAFGRATGSPWLAAIDTLEKALKTPAGV